MIGKQAMGFAALSGLLALLSLGGPAGCDFSGEPRDATSDPDVAGEVDAVEEVVEEPVEEVVEEPVEDVAGEPDVGDDVYIILIADLTSSAQYYTWEAPPVTVSFFALLGSDGTPHVAIDACDVCYRECRGYSQVGTSMRCNNCGNTYPIDGLGTENLGTGCWPGYLPIVITATEVIIQHSDLNDSAWYFSGC